MSSRQVSDNLRSSLNALEFPRLREEIVHFAETEPAREKLAELYPSSNKAWIIDELKRVEEIKGYIERGGVLSIGGTSDVRPVLQKAAVKGSALQAEDLLTVLQHVRIHQKIRRTLDKERSNIPLTYNLTKGLQILPELEKRIEDAISPEGLVRDKASKELARIRKQISIVQLDVRKKIGSLYDKFARQGVMRGDSFTLRDGRYVLPVRSDSMGKIRGIIHDRSSTGGTLFVEPSSIIDLGNELRSLELAERDEVLRILRELTKSVHENLEVLKINLDVLTAMDCIWAKARYAHKIDAVNPIINENGRIKIVQGRHPLLLNRETYVVPLDLELGVEYSCLVISGPNAGGKTVALKCVGLLCIMTACGLQLPVLPGSEIPIVDKYFVVIGDEQSITDDLSTFTAHVSRLKEILQYADNGSLVLVDEIGAGTDPQEGASLSISALEQLAKRRILTIVTTHHGSLKAFAHSNESCANGSMAFNQETFEPTYFFHPNIPGSSYALDIAKRVGLNEKIIKRAREILGADHTHLDDLIHTLSDKLRRYDELVVSEERRKSDFTDVEKTYRERLNRVKEREKELKKNARETVADVLKEARRSIEALVKEIRESQASKESIKAAHSGLKELEEKYAVEQIHPKSGGKTPQKAAAKKKKKKLPQKEESKLIQKNLDVGNWVTIDESDIKGEIVALSAKKDRLCVAIGSVQLWINADRIDPIKPPDSQKVEIKQSSGSKVPFEIDLRGLDRMEALDQVERYIYDGSSQGREQLGIIHGKGKGVLSRAVREYLKKHKLVESYRFGEFGEGDYGVTIVKLKSSK